MKKIIFACLLVLFLSGCQSWDQKLILVNKSQHTIHYWVSCDSSFKRMQFKQENELKPNDTIKPYLLYGPEGKGSNKEPWINAINSADDKSLHVFCYYVDFANDSDKNDNWVSMNIKRLDFNVDSLETLHWLVNYY